MKVKDYPTRILQYVLGVDSAGKVGKNVPGGPTGPPPTLIAGTAGPGAYDIDVVDLGDGEYRIDITIPPGLDGATPTLIGGTVTTLPAGSPATASLSPTGNPNEYELDLGIPKGADGTGTVNGPATSTVDYLVRWNSTDGTILKEGIPLNAVGGVQGYSAKTAAFAALTWATDSIAYMTGTSTLALTALTSQARTLISRTSFAAMVTDLGLVIGTNVQAYSLKLAAIDALTWANDRYIYLTGTSTAAIGTLTSFMRTVLDDTDALTARTTLGAEPSGMALGITTYTASQTAVIGNAGYIVEMNVASANNYTIPLNATVAFPLNTRIDIVSIGAGQTTIVATGGVTIRSEDAKLKLTKQYSGASIYKRGTDEWVLIGSLAA